MNRSWRGTVWLTLLIAVEAASVEARVVAEVRPGADGAEHLRVQLGCAVEYLRDGVVAEGVEIALLAGAGCGASGAPAVLGGELVRGVDVESQAGVLLVTIATNGAVAAEVRAGVDGQSVDLRLRPVDVAVAAVSSSGDVVAPGETQLDTLVEAQLDTLVAEAEHALKTADYPRAALLFERLQEESAGERRRRAAELLGVAYQRDGARAHAVAAYRAFLDDYPSGPDADRVRQRLAVLLETDPTRQTAGADPGPLEHRFSARRWHAFGAFQQEYVGSGAYALAEGESATGLDHSAVLTFVDFGGGYRGNRFDVRTRVDGGFLKDLEAGGSGDDQVLLSNAYAEVGDLDLDWRLRIGRQSLSTDGVLGRFDGVRASYRWRPRLGANVTVGLPVDSPRYGGDDRRTFAAGSLDFDDPSGRWSLTGHGLVQEIDGIADRRSLGAAARFHSGRWRAIARLDYEASYDVLNSALLIGSVRVHPRLLLTGRVNFHGYPFLSSRNALIGQPVATVEELLESYSEGQIRTLARNRTADARDAALGLSATLSQRWRFRGDVTYSEFGATVASGGVAARPASGPQFHSVASFVGTSIFRAGDTAIFGYRLDSSRSADVNTVDIDVRLPLGRSLRLNPRLAVAYHRAAAPRIVVSPRLRLAMRVARRYRFELEAGGRWSQREVAATEAVLYGDASVDDLGYFFMARWGVDF